MTHLTSSPQSKVISLLIPSTNILDTPVEFVPLSHDDTLHLLAQHHMLLMDKKEVEKEIEMHRKERADTEIHALQQATLLKVLGACKYIYFTTLS
jgi:hypothetical protein